jgi:predicted MFS family arabinose efflux permease
VPDEELANAVSLNTIAHTVARSIGPAIAGVLIVAVGIQWCFAINALSYGVVLLSLLAIDRSSMRSSRSTGRSVAHMRDGLRYTWSHRRLRPALVICFVLGLFVLNWNVILPVYSTTLFSSDASVFGLLVGIMGLGASVGAVATSRLRGVTGHTFWVIAAILAAALTIVTMAPNLPIAIVGLGVLGAAAAAFQISAQVRLQLETDDAMSGRVLALFSVGLVGTRPIGSLWTGSILDASGPREAFGASAIAVFALLIYLMRGRGSGWLARWRRHPSPTEAAGAILSGEEVPSVPAGNGPQAELEEPTERPAV